MKTLLLTTLLALFAVQPASSEAPSPSIGTGGQDLLKTMRKAQREYYELSFSYAMSGTQTGEIYEWRSHYAEGQIRPGRRFANQYGNTCRPFAETYKVGRHHGQNTGFGCKRQGADGWCKLREGNMLNCALEKEPDTADKVASEIKAVGNKATEAAKNAESSFWSWWPF